MKKTISVLLCAALLCTTFLFSGAAEPARQDASDGQSDFVRCTGWKTVEYYTYDYLYEIILHPRYVERANVRVTDKNAQNTFEENTDFTVQQQDVEGYGTCFVLYVVTNGRAAYLQPNSFSDKNGNGNEKLYLTDGCYRSGRRIVNLDTAFNLGGNVMETGSETNITFETSGAVTFGGKVLAEDVDAYTLKYDEPGEHTLDLSVGGLTVAKYNIRLKTPEQIRNERIDELKKELSETSAAFFKSLPLALVTLPLAPLAIFGFLWPFAPIEIAGRYFDLLRELRSLQSRR